MASPIKLPDELLQVIGSIVVYHAELEHWIDAMVHTVHLYIPASNTYQKKYPIDFKSECIFLRKSLTDLPELKSFQAEGIAILDEIERISEDRSHIVHGFVRFWGEGRLEFTRVHRMDGRPAVAIVSITPEQLERDLERIDTFRDPVEKLARSIMKALMPERRLKQATGDES